MAPSLPVPVPVSLPADRSLSETLHRVETVVWSLSTGATALLLVATVAGAFVVSGRPVDLPVVALLAATVLGTLGFVAADLVFG